MKKVLKAVYRVACTTSVAIVKHPSPSLRRFHAHSVLLTCLIAGLGASSLMLPTTAHAQRRVASMGADELFAALRDAARKNDAERAQALAGQLSGYAIPSYVEYYRLKPQLFDSAGQPRMDTPDAEIAAFLQRYAGTAIADRLRNDWLLALGKRRDWATFDREAPLFQLNDDTQVKCYGLLSRMAKGQPVAADARTLLIDPRYYGEACLDLIEALGQNGQFTTLDLRTQARWALEQNLPTVVNQMAARLGALPGGADTERDAVASAIRLARTDPQAAIAYFGGVAEGLPRQDLAAGWGTIAQFLARKLDPQALTYYKLAASLGGDALLSSDSQEWRVRAALRAGDWLFVRQSIEAMSPALRAKDPAWTYWYGRALKTEGRLAEAQQQFQALAGQFHFYGQLSLEELGLPIALPPAARIDEADVEAIRQRDGFARAQRFYAMDMRFEGNREWNWELRSMSDRELLAAAEYAQRIDLLDRAVNSADRTRYEHDFALRFITPFRQTMQRYTDQLGLDMAWVYGLIRQESRFIGAAKSHVGASGLMQVMPTTARYVAKKIGLGPISNSALHEIDTNILLGTNYLNMVLNDLGGSWALASAAYNAGPKRPKNWRAQLTRPVEGAIFAETIPFSETRTYVKNVLSNATYYAVQFSGRPQSLKARLGMVDPQQDNASDLP